MKIEKQDIEIKDDTTVEQKERASDSSFYSLIEKQIKNPTKSKWEEYAEEYEYEDNT